VPVPPHEWPAYERDVAAVRTALGDARFTEEWNAGRLLSPDEAVSEATAALSLS
jgi:hypothetical protein